jgi:SAM-dependent methyltransferase
VNIDNLLFVLRHLIQLPRFIYEYIKFKREATDWECKFTDLLPMLQDRTQVMGFDTHYVYHTGWAARILQETTPKEHVDISSSIMFCSIASAFVKIKHYDYRTPVLTLPGLECGSQDLLQLSFADNSVDSLSCMHVIEHIGLGRYGDPINAKGDELAAGELTRVLAPGGQLLVVLPLAERARIRYNGHRIYNLKKVKELFPNLAMIEFSFLNDVRSNHFFRNASASDIIDSDYGCGCFLFKKQNL